MKIRRAAALAALLSALLASHPGPPARAAQPPERQDGGPPAENRIRLASQTPWVGPGQELVIRVLVTTPVPFSDLELAVSVFRRLTSRSEFTRSLETRPRGAPLSVTSTPLSQLAPDSAGALTIRLPIQDAGQPSELSRLRLTGEGVYPVRVELRESKAGATLAELGTNLIHTRPPPPDGRPMGVALVLPIHAPPALQPDGRREPSTEAAESLGHLARSLAAHPMVPLTLVPTPETLTALAASPRDADRETLRALAQGAVGRQIAATSYVPISIPASMGAGLEDETAAQLALGAAVVSQTLGTTPDLATWVSDEHLDEQSVQRLQEQQVNRLVVPESSMAPVDLPLTITQPFQLRTSSPSGLEVMAADQGLAAHFSSSDDPALAAHRLLADLATLYFDRPGRPRAVTAVAPRSWSASTPFLDTLLAALGTSPVAAGVTLGTAFGTVPKATTTAGAPLVRSLNPDRMPTEQLSGPAVRAARRRLQSFASMLGPDNRLDESIEELLMVAQDSDLRPRQRADYLNGANRRIDQELGQIEVPADRSITITARAGEIPVTVLSRADYPVRLRIQVASDKLEFPAGAVREIGLQRRNTTERFSVHARASGAFPLRVQLVSPDGGLLLGRSRLTVRSTAASGVGVLLSVGAGAFLLLWWGRHFRGRRNRRLVPA